MEVCSRLSETLIRQSRSSFALRNPSRLCLCTSRTLYHQPRSFNTTARRRQHDRSSGTGEGSPPPPTEPRSGGANTDALGTMIENTMKQMDLSASHEEPSKRPQKAESKEDINQTPLDAMLADLWNARKEDRESKSRNSRPSPVTDILNLGPDRYGLNSPRSAPPPKPQELNFKLGPSVGKTVRVGSGVDIARAFRKLDMVCANNRIRADVSRQRFHERPGLRRKRLKSERWRRRFREGFQALVTKVRAMKKQGW